MTVRPLLFVSLATLCTVLASVPYPNAARALAAEQFGPFDGTYVGTSTGNGPRCTSGPATVIVQGSSGTSSAGKKLQISTNGSLIGHEMNTYTDGKVFPETIRGQISNGRLLATASDTSGCSWSINLTLQSSPSPSTGNPPQEGQEAADAPPSVLDGTYVGTSTGNGPLCKSGSFSITVQGFSWTSPGGMNYRLSRSGYLTAHGMNRHSDGKVYSETISGQISNGQFTGSGGDTSGCSWSINMALQSSPSPDSGNPTQEGQEAADTPTSVHDALACLVQSRGAQGNVVLHNRCNYDVQMTIGPAGSPNANEYFLRSGRNYPISIPGKVAWAACPAADGGPVAETGAAWFPINGQFHCQKIP